MAELQSGLDDLAAGRGGLYLVTGEPGIGKTKLADELAKGAASGGVNVHWGRAWEAGGAPPFWIFAQVLRSICRGLEDADLVELVGRRGPELGAFLPELRARVPALAHAPAPAVERFQLFDAVEGFLHAASARAPRLVVLDDLHAADPSSLELLDLLARDLRSHPILLLGTYREAEARLVGEVSRALERVAREACRLPLDRLDRGQVAAFLEQAAGAPPTAERVDAVYRLTEGNPLFVRELLQLKGAARLPESVREVIRARLSLLTDASRRALEAAAVLGREFEVEPLAALVGASELEVRAAIEPAAHAAVVEPLEQSPRWRFTHLLLRDALYDELDGARRAELHRAAALALGRGDAEPHLAEVAHHMSLAIPAATIAEAADAARRAAEQAMRQLAFEDAVGLWARASELLRDEPNQERRLAEALLGLGSAEIRAADVNRGKQDCLRAAELARRLGDGELFARAVLASTYELVPWARDEPLIALLEEALARLPEGDGALRARCMAQLAAERQPEPDTAPPIELARAAVAMARRVGDAPTLLATLSSAGHALLAFGDPRERLAIDGDCLRLALAAGELRIALRAHLYLAADLAELGDSTGSWAQLRALETLAAGFLHDRFAWLLVGIRMIAAIHDGDFEVAAALLREIDARSGADESRGGSVAAAPIALCRIRERYDDLPAIEARVRASFATLRHGLAECVGEMFVAQLYGRAGDRQRAAIQLTIVRAHPIFDAIVEPAFLALLAEPVSLLGDGALAERIYEAMAPRAERFVNLSPLAVGCETPYAHGLGLLALTLGRPDDAVAHLEDALRATLAAQLRGHLARLRYELAGALVARGAPGDGERATVLLVEARELATQLGQTGLLAAIAARAPTETPVATYAATATTFSMRREGDVWAVACGAVTVRLRDSRGMQVLERLVGTPGREHHVLELVGSGGETADDADAGPMLDDVAVQSYRGRLAELRGELDEAEAHADAGRVARARREIDFLTGELSRAIGLAGKSRRAASTAERARTTVQKRLRDAIRRIGAELPELGRHLEQTVRTGAFCGYLPEGRRLRQP